MRKWLVPLIVFSAGGIGAYLLTGKRREALREWLDKVFASPETWHEWNQAAQSELELIQQSLNRIAQSLEPGPQAEHP